jgi:hypothetical protein
MNIAFLCPDRPTNKRGLDYVRFYCLRLRSCLQHVQLGGEASSIKLPLSIVQAPFKHTLSVSLKTKMTILWSVQNNFNFFGVNVALKNPGHQHMILVYKAHSYTKETIACSYVPGTEPFKNDQNDDMEVLALRR